MVEFVIDARSYMILRSRWFHVIVLNVHAPTEDKAYDVENGSKKEFERTFDRFS
jgi:hypothetical protein